MHAEPPYKKDQSHIVLEKALDQLEELVSHLNDIQQEAQHLLMFLGVDRIAAYCAGKATPNDARLKHLADVLNVTPDELVRKVSR